MVLKKYDGASWCTGCTIWEPLDLSTSIKFLLFCLFCYTAIRIIAKAKCIALHYVNEYFKEWGIMFSLA